MRDRTAAGHRGKPKPSGPNNALYGKVLSDEQKRKISEWTKRGMTPEVIEKITKNRGNFKHSEETKKKMSKTHKAITPRGPDHPWYGKPGTMLGKKEKTGRHT